MSDLSTTAPLALTELWYTRCPVPTASGLAYNLGWLSEEFTPDDLEISALQDASPEFTRHHLDHQLPGLFREGGNIPALVARAAGAPSRLVGLTWIDERQSILVRPDSDIDSPARLRGARVGIPRWTAERGLSIWRGMALAGFAGALRAAGLNFADVRIVEIPAWSAGPSGSGGVAQEPRLPSFDALLAGEVDAIYGKGALVAETSLRAGLVVGIDLDAIGDRQFRVNNGTPRPLTIHQGLLDERPDLVVRFLAQTLRASDWAADHLEDVRSILDRETGSGPDGVALAYRDGFHRSLHPNLSESRLALLAQQKSFLLLHGFLSEDFDLEAWVAREPLEAARQLANRWSSL
jgi:ABC-type nitrate/sulfonate/bicarbonate transport system substrate-binding protein